MSDLAPTSISDKLELDCEAPDTAVTLRSKPMQVDFTGKCTILTTGGASNPAGRFLLTAMHLVADLPDAGGTEDGETITLRLHDTDLTATITQPGGTIHLQALKLAELPASASQFLRTAANAG